MENINDMKDKVKISYPTKWTYKVIGKDIEKIKLGIINVMEEQKFEMKLSKTSSSAKYYSIKLVTTVFDENHRNLLYNALSNYQDIITVI